MAHTAVPRAPGSGHPPNLHVHGAAASSSPRTDGNPGAGAPHVLSLGAEPASLDDFLAVWNPPSQPGPRAAAAAVGVDQPAGTSGVRPARAATEGHAATAVAQAYTEAEHAAASRRPLQAGGAAVAPGRGFASDLTPVGSARAGTGSSHRQGGESLVWSLARTLAGEAAPAPARMGDVMRHPEALRAATAAAAAAVRLALARHGVGHPRLHPAFAGRRLVVSAGPSEGRRALAVSRAVGEAAAVVGEPLSIRHRRVEATASGGGGVEAREGACSVAVDLVFDDARDAAAAWLLLPRFTVDGLPLHTARPGGTPPRTLEALRAEATLQLSAKPGEEGAAALDQACHLARQFGAVVEERGADAAGSAAGALLVLWSLRAAAGAAAAVEACSGRGKWPASPVRAVLAGTLTGAAAGAAQGGSGAGGRSDQPRSLHPSLRRLLDEDLGRDGGGQGGSDRAGGSDSGDQRRDGAGTGPSPPVWHLEGASERRRRRNGNGSPAAVGAGEGAVSPDGTATPQGGLTALDTHPGAELVAPPSHATWRSAAGAQKHYAAVLSGAGSGEGPKQSSSASSGRAAPQSSSVSPTDRRTAGREGVKSRGEAGSGERRSPGSKEQAAPGGAKQGGGKARANSVDSSGSGTASPVPGGGKEKRKGQSSKFALDHDRISRGDDRRTTVMVRNIPNKYTQQLLLQELDETLHGTFDWLYLPIDFKNRCNIGYAFVNFVHPRHIVTLSLEFSGKRWRRFNSDKMCDVTYARIQGKDELIRHFQKSAVMTEKEEYRPLLFRTDPGKEGEQVPFSVAAAAAVTSPVSSSSSSSAYAAAQSPTRSVSSGGGGGTPRARPENWADRVREGTTRARRRMSSSGDSVLSAGPAPTGGGSESGPRAGTVSRLRANTGDSNDTEASGGRRRSKRRGGRRRNKQ